MKILKYFGVIVSGIILRELLIYLANLDSDNMVVWIGTLIWIITGIILVNERKS